MKFLTWNKPQIASKCWCGFPTPFHQVYEWSNKAHNISLRHEDTHLRVLFDRYEDPFLQFDVFCCEEVQVAFCIFLCVAFLDPLDFCKAQRQDDFSKITNEHPIMKHRVTNFQNLTKRQTPCWTLHWIFVNLKNWRPSIRQHVTLSKDQLLMDASHAMAREKLRNFIDIKINEPVHVWLHLMGWHAAHSAW